MRVGLRIALLALAACSVDDRSVSVTDGASAGSSGDSEQMASPALQPGRELETVDSFEFGVVEPGQAGVGVLVVRNAGDQTITDLSAGIAGDSAQEFKANPPADCAELGSGASCSVKLEFRPLAQGERSATLVLVAAGILPVQVQLRGGAPVSSEEGAGALPLGGGVPPSSPASDDGLVLSMSALAFPGAEVAAGSAVQSVEVRNATGAPISNLQVEVESDGPQEFWVDTACAELAPQASCAVQVRFQPLTAGPRTGNLVVSDGVRSVPLALSGTGQYRLTVVRAGAGVGQVKGPGIECGAGSEACTALVDPGKVELNATTTNGSGSFFSSWSGAEDCAWSWQGCSLQLNGPLTVTATFSVQTNNLVFLSSEHYPSDFGSTAAFDAECNRLASAAGINNAAGNGYVSATSGPQSFLDRIPAGVRGWVRMDGLPFGDQMAQMLGDAPELYYPVRYDESGAWYTGLGAFTGADANGQVASNCNNFTSVSADQYMNSGTFQNLGGWLSYGNDFCARYSGVYSWQGVYCLGITKTVPLALPTFSGKRIWITNTNFRIGSMTPDQKCQSERPAGVAAARALVAYTGRSAFDVLDPAVTYVRPDGQLVGTAGDMAAFFMPGVPWIAADGSRVDRVNIWTGQARWKDPELKAVAADTCADWTDPSGSAIVGLSGDSSGRAFDVTNDLDDQVACDGNGFNVLGSGGGRLYCIEP